MNKTATYLFTTLLSLLLSLPASNADSSTKSNVSAAAGKSATSGKAGSASGAKTAASTQSAAAKAPAQARKAATAKTATAKAASTKTGSALKSHSPAKTTVSAHPLHPPIKATAIPATVSADGLPIWLPVKSAKLAARAKNKMIVADFFTDWCGWCKIMDKKTFHDPAVAAFLAKNFVCMKANAQDGADGEELAGKFDIQGFPTIMIFDAGGKKITAIEGYRDPQQFMKDIKSAVPSAK